VEAVTEAAKRFNWYNNTHFEVINKEGVDLIVELCDENRDEDLIMRIAVRNMELTDKIDLEKYEKLRPILKEFGYSAWRARWAALDDNQKNNPNNHELFILKTWIIKELDYVLEDSYKNYDKELRRMMKEDIAKYKKKIAKWFEVRSFAQVENYKEESFEDFHHFHYEEKPLEPKNVLHSLLRQMQKLINTQQHFKRKGEMDQRISLPELVDQASIQKLKETKEEERTKRNEKIKDMWDQDATVRKSKTFDDFKREKLEEMARPAKLKDSFKSIFTIGYTPRDKDSTLNFFRSMTTFTVVDWQMIERVLNDSSCDVAMIDRMQMIQIAFSVLPGGNTVLH